MNSDTKRILSQFDHYDNPNVYGTYYSQQRLWERLTHPTVLISIVVLGLAICYQRASQSGQLRALPDHLWDAVVRLTPARLLYAIDNWLNPPLFPTPMRQSQPCTHAAKSDVLRRVLGVDKPGGIMMSVSQAGLKSLGGLAGSSMLLKGDSERPAGLGNWDNSCYQNSILQSLAALKPLPSYLTTFAADGTPGLQAPNTRTANALRDLIMDLNSASNNGTTLWTPSILKNMSTWQQQDAQEYFSKLLDEMDKEIAKVSKAAQKPAGFENDLSKDETAFSQHSDDSGYQSLSSQSKTSSEPKLIRNPLEGLVAQRVACTACGYSEGLSMIPFNCLTLSLGTDKTEHDLYERLDSYTKVESIPGVDCAKCTLLKYRNLIKIIIERSRKAGTKDEDFPEPFTRLEAIETALEEDDFEDATLSRDCKILPQQRVSSTKTKQVAIARPPQSLAIHMNRSVFDETTGHMFKNPGAVRFPMTLDLGPWCLGSADALTGQVSETTETLADEKAALAAKDEEQWLLDPTASMVAGDLHPSKISGPIYELRAVITHYGRHENGHYVCYRKHALPSHRGGEEKPPQLKSERDKDEVDSLDGSGSFADGRHDAADPSDQPELQETEELDGQWWRLSDQDVTMAGEETVLAQGGVFMLFYDCVDPKPVMTADVDAFADVAVSQAEVDESGPREVVAAAAAVGESSTSASTECGQASVLEMTTESADEVLEKAARAPLPATSGVDDGL